MIEEQVKVRIAELETQLKQLIEQANLQAARISGGIEELRALLPTEQQAGGNEAEC